MRSFIISIILSFCFSNLFAQSNNPNLTISHLKEDLYIYESYNYWKGDRISANAMYLVTDSGVVLFDTSWDSTQFQPLLDTIKAKHKKEVVICIATHFHDDRSGGLKYYKQQNIKTYTTLLTDELSKKNGKKRAEFLIEKDTVFTVGQYSFEIYYPGKGHAPDNIVVWFEKQKILYGGCLVKSTEDDTLGNLSDASIPDYANSIKNVLAKCRKPRYIITGHGSYNSKKSLKHTLKMAETLRVGEGLKN